jgi:3-hydroxymyristoyl/3-hydroxydecanoyl-(acyl carrier protein) dehydratase
VSEPTPLADILELVDERRFRLLGRANDLIHVAGKRSSLGHLDFHLQRIAGVEDGAFWLPDERPGEVVRPVAFVVAPHLTARDIVAALRSDLEDVFLPRRVVHVDALPREATGKLTAAALRAFALGRLAPVGEDRVATPGPSAAARGADAPEVDRIELAVPSEHPAFAGHFPGHPVLPGAVLLAMVVEALAGRAGWPDRPGSALAVPQLKFLAPVAPAARLTLEWHGAATGTIAFEVRAGEHAVARGRIGVLR